MSDIDTVLTSDERFVLAQADADFKKGKLRQL